MKTIKDLDRIRARHDLTHFSRGYYQALKDVLKLIAELKFISKWAKEELKSKIEG